MPSTTGNSKAPAGSELTLSKRHAPLVDTEEERLLGGSNDAGAVRIGKPQARPPSHMSAVKIPSGGPIPRNTLSGHSQLTNLRANQSTQSRLKGNIQNELQTETSRGSNVRRMPHATDQDTGFALPTAKRQKTKHQPSSPSSAQSINDPLDSEAPGSISFGAFSRSGSRAHSPHSQGSGFQLRRSSSSTGSLQEHKSIERMMNSRPISKKKQRRLNNQSQQQNHNLSGMSSISNPIDISGDDEVMDVKTKPTATARIPYQGTMRKDPPIARASDSAKAAEGSSTEWSSPFFPYTSGAHVTSKDKQTRSIVDHHEDQSKRLADSFIPVNGLRRGSDVNMSSDFDELQDGGNTVGHLAETNITLSTTHSRQNSPSKTSTSILQPTSPTELSQGLPESNIKPSTFISAKPTVQSRNSDLVGRLREKKPAWAVEVAALSYKGELIERPDMGLVYNEKDKYYALVSNGVQQSIRINPDKLQKIFYAESGGKVRFLSSKSGNEDNMLDLQFCNDKDAAALVSRLAEHSHCKEHISPREQMEKIFAKKRQEYQKSTKNSGRTEDLGNVQPECNPWQPAIDSTSKTSEVSAEIRHGRSGRSLVDDLWDRAGRNNAGPAERGRKPMLNGLPTEKSISEHLDIMRPQAHNDHLRRSTRTYRTTAKASQSPMANLERSPERYSRIHGLGDQWSKPLIYPKEGKKRITVEFSDLEKLDEGVFLNDSLISFYLRFLEQQLGERQSDVANRVYFFNTYFYTTLTNTNKSNKGINYQGVQKWTRSVDLFTYDYIVVPINESMHWYLAIICNLPALRRSPETSGEIPSSLAEAGNVDIGEESKDFVSPSSSPVPELAPEDSRDLLEDAKEVEETETRNSFAEMSLNNAIVRPAINSVAFKENMGAQTADQQDQDQEMLDAQFEDTTPGPTAAKEDLSAYADERIDNEETTTDALDQTSTFFGKSKKQRKKSMPPSITRTDPNKPVIIILDSIGVSRGATIKALKDYLHEEARTKRGGMEFDSSQIKGMNAKVPQQSNYSDCGLFLLGYVAKFLEDDPKDFIANVIARRYDEKKDWAKLVPSTMRASIRDQVQQLHSIQERERQSAKKNGKLQDKGDKKPEPSPTRMTRYQVESSNQGAVKVESAATKGSRFDEELPSEVPDSQPSGPSRSFRQTSAEQESFNLKAKEISEKLQKLKDAIRPLLTAEQLAKHDDNEASHKEKTKSSPEDHGIIDVIDVDDVDD